MSISCAAPAGSYAGQAVPGLQRRESCPEDLFLYSRHTLLGVRTGVLAHCCLEFRSLGEE